MYPDVISGKLAPWRIDQSWISGNLAPWRIDQNWTPGQLAPWRIATCCLGRQVSGAFWSEEGIPGLLRHVQNYGSWYLVILPKWLPGQTTRLEIFLSKFCVEPRSQSQDISYLIPNPIGNSKYSSLAITSTWISGDADGDGHGDDDLLATLPSGQTPSPKRTGKEYPIRESLTSTIQYSLHRKSHAFLFACIRVPMHLWYVP